MHRSALRWLVVLGGILGIVLATRMLPAADDLGGRWKLVVQAFNDDTFFIFDLEESDAKPSAKVVSAQNRIYPEASLTDVTVKDGIVSFKVDSGGGSDRFVGATRGEGENANKIYGTYWYRDSPFPAVLERTEDMEVAALGRGPIPQRVFAAQREHSGNELVAELEKILAEFKGNPTAYFAYEAIVSNAGSAELTTDDLKKYATQWIDGSKPYGPAWQSATEVKLLEALAGQKAYDELRFELSGQIWKSLSPATSTNQRAAVAQAWYDSAVATNHPDVAEQAQKIWNELEEKLDVEYRDKVPPFKPEAFAGRHDPANDRVVLFELFTGAQCPPCVAADVGFDALLHTYQPSELVVLQYHLHIPGPDPLTNTDTLARAEYYEASSTPSTFFDGAAEGGGGGGMGQSQIKYNQFRGLVDERLETKKKAEIDLNVTRSGSVISVAAMARADVASLQAAKEAAKKAAEDAKADDDGKNGDQADEDKDEPAKPVAEEGDDAVDEPASIEPHLRLRLVLVEEEVRYLGGNQLRFHHHIVRHMPGGPEGTELVSGEAEKSVQFDLDQVRRDLDEYLDAAAKEDPFPKPRPPIDLAKLAVVAIVQNDADKSVWHAKQVAVPE